MAQLIVGTAGHIDHGKSSLVRAITGTDPDRLPEEKKRGITIDLGYAFLDEVAAIIDVPGHEKLIRNMVAGAATIDFALLVIAADDGVMPQTTEHLHILRLLGVREGAIVITKIDMVESEWLDLVEEQIRTAAEHTFLAAAPVFRVDSLSGKGIPEFREALLSILAQIPARRARGVLRLPIDRVFQVKGRGTVVTGTILSGRLKRDDRLVALPGRIDMRVKRIETHGHEMESLQAGQRAALNLIGDTEKLQRGMTLTVEGGLFAATRLRIVIERLAHTELLKDRQRIRLLIGTQEAIGRVQLLERESRERIYANLLMEEEVVAAWGDRFVLRRYSPLETLGGGIILEQDSPRLRSRDLPDELAFAHRLDTADAAQAFDAILTWRGRFGIEIATLARALAWTETEVDEHVRSLPPDKAVSRIGDLLLVTGRLNELAAQTLEHLKALHKKTPGATGFTRSDLSTGPAKGLPEAVFDYLIQALLQAGKIAQDGAYFREPQRKVELSPAQIDLIARVAAILKTQPFTPPIASIIAEELKRPKPEIEKTLVLMERLGQCRRLGVDLFFDAASFDHGIAAVIEHLRSANELSVADAARLLASSRKYVVPFLEYLDGKGITERRENVRARGRNYPLSD